MARRITRLTAAIHEAGHLAAMLSDPAGSHIESVMVASSGHLLGYVDCVSLWQPFMSRLDPLDPVNAPFVDAARRDIIQYLAGPIAELRWKRHSRWDIIFAADQFAARCLDRSDHAPGSDFDRVKARIEWAYATDQRRIFGLLWCEAEDLVARQWMKIKHVGRMLDAACEMSGDEVLAAWDSLDRKRQ